MTSQETRTWQLNDTSVRTSLKRRIFQQYRGECLCHTALQSKIPNFAAQSKPEASVETECQDRAAVPDEGCQSVRREPEIYMRRSPRSSAVPIEPAYVRDLSKTGIFQLSAGDFGESGGFRCPVRRTDTFSNPRKPTKCRPFSGDLAFHPNHRKAGWGGRVLSQIGAILTPLKSLGNPERYTTCVALQCGMLQAG